MTPQAVVALAATALQAAARQGSYGVDSSDVAEIGRAAMAVSPGTCARVGARLMRAALEADPAVVLDETVVVDLEALDAAVRAFVGEAA